MLNTIIANAEKYINGAIEHTKGGITKTNILNAEYRIGQFTACMDLIEDIDIDIYVTLAEKYKADREQVCLFVDKLYYL